MAFSPFRNLVASALCVALALATPTAMAASEPASISGVVYGQDVATPLVGATVVVTDGAGVQVRSQPTRADGAFSIANIVPGRATITLETSDASFRIATPVTLAPGETRGVHLALKKAGSPAKDDKRKKGAVGWTGGAVGGMVAVIIGFVAAAAANIDRHNSDNTPASPSTLGER